jgi:drug/metabolite transporter (DMT)-like permease
MGRRLVTLIEIFQAGIGLLLGATSFYLLAQTRQSSDPDVRAGLEIASAVVLAIAVPAGVSCWGVVKRRWWGWWLAFAIDVAGLVLFLWDPVADRSWPDWEEVGFIVLFGIPVVLLLLGTVRRQFARNATVVSDSGKINS